ncbi:YncE family protein [Streptomyces flavidovirens]
MGGCGSQSNLRQWPVGTHGRPLPEDAGGAARAGLSPGRRPARPGERGTTLTPPRKSLPTGGLVAARPSSLPRRLRLVCGFFGSDRYIRLCRAGCGLVQGGHSAPWMLSPTAAWGCMGVRAVLGCDPLLFPPGRRVSPVLPRLLAAAPTNRLRPLVTVSPARRHRPGSSPTILAALTAALALAASPATAETSSERAGSGWPVRVTVFVANSGSGTLSAYDAQLERLLGDSTVGSGPTGLSSAPDGNTVFTANSRSNTVSFVDTTTRQVTATVPVGVRPFAAVPSRDGTRVLTADYGSDTAAIIDVASSRVTATVSVGALPHTIATIPNGTAYFTNHGAGTVTALGPDNRVSATIPVGTFPTGISATARGDSLYVSNTGSGNVSVIDTATNKVSAVIPAGTAPLGNAVSPEGKHLYIADSAANTLLIANTQTGTTTARIPVGAGPQGVALSPGGQRAWVTNEASDTVSVIDTTTALVRTTLPTGDQPEGITITPR